MAAPVTLQQLITAITQPQYLAQIIANHQANGVPWQSWLSSRNVGLSLSQIASNIYATLSSIITQTVQGMFIDYSQGVPLTLFSKSQYQNVRTPAQFTVGRHVLSGVAAGRTTTFSPGQLTDGPPGAANQIFFSNQDGGTLAPGSLSIGGTAQGLLVVKKVPGSSSRSPWPATRPPSACPRRWGP